MPSVNVYCTLGNIECRHCSNEIYHNYKRASDIKTHAVIRLNKCIPLGLYCNNECTWVSQIKVCPIPDAVEVCKKAISAFDPDDPLRWMKRKCANV
jgi:hypothetical protein